MEKSSYIYFLKHLRLGVPSRLLVFPKENHWVLKAQNSIIWHSNVIEWLDKWLKE